jgi:hypothetical protein
MKRLTILFFFVTAICHAQVQLSDRASISVLTLGPSQQALYTAFGHSAFRVHDPVAGIDYAYNYGVFDYNRPHFYLNFARGHNVYRLGVFDYRNFEYEYIYFNRSIHEQVLNLRPAEKQKLFDFLEWNARPENQEYLYDYFYDNCATKIPEVVLKVFGESVKFDGSYITTDYSFRDLTDLYLGQQPWGDLGIDIGLGLPTDKKATPYEYMFLPDFVQSGFDHASIRHDGSWEPLVKETRITYESHPEEHGFNPLHPFIIFSAFLLVTALLTYRDLKRKKLTNIFDGIVFGILGVLGIVLALLWVATNHHAAAKNFNLLWALPTHIVAVIAFIRRPRWLSNYFLAVAILTALLLISWPFLPQNLNDSLIPLVIAIGIRAFAQFSIRKGQVA